MAESNVDIVRRLIERFGDDSLDGVFELLSEDVVMVVPPSMSTEPDVYEGFEGARRYIGGFAGMLDDVRFVPSEMFEEDGRVIAVMQLRGRGVSSGIEVTLDAVSVFWVEAGKVKRIETHPDLHSARQALSSRPSA
jgi:ketosteroid isomerase-like protein